LAHFTKKQNVSRVSQFSPCEEGQSHWLYASSGVLNRYFSTDSSQFKLSELNWKFHLFLYQNTVVFSSNTVETSSCVISYCKYLNIFHPQQEEQQFVLIVHECYTSYQWPTTLFRILQFT
jgi:hypothetical protein